MAPYAIEVHDGPDPAALPGQAVLRSEAVGLCGSDYHIFDGSHPYSHYPRTQGHEVVAVIESLPRDYHGTLKAGQRVVVEPVMSCGQCFPCRRGRGNCCVSLQVLGVQVDGGLAERFALEPGLLHPVGGLEPLTAVLAEPISIGLHAVQRGMVAAGDRVAVLGAGIIGQSIVLAAVDRGARVLVADRIRRRLDRALVMGAEQVVDSTRTDVVAATERFTDGAGATVVLEATGHAPMLRLAVEIVAHSGTVVAVGTSMEPLQVPVAEFSRKEISLVGSRNSVGLFREAVTMVHRHAHRLASLVTHQFGLPEVASAMAMGRDHPEAAGKVVVMVDPRHG
jgi:L-gulonate 5-dehydrogenase